MAFSVAVLLLFCGLAIAFLIYPTVKCFETKNSRKSLLTTHDSHVKMTRSGRPSATENQENQGFDRHKRAAYITISWTILKVIGCSLNYPTLAYQTVNAIW